MVGHEVVVKGVSLAGVAQDTPAVLKVHDEDFPGRFLRDLAVIGPSLVSTIETMTTSPTVPVTLYQPVHRILHIVLLQLTCDTLGYPRVDPKRVQSAGVVIRRIVRSGSADWPDKPPSAWMRSPDGQFQWVAPGQLPSQFQENDDPDPTQRPQLQSGQPDCDRQLALQALATAQSEIYTPAFVAPPAVCDAAKRTLLYAVLPTASSEVSRNTPPIPQYDPQSLARLASGLPRLLQAGPHRRAQIREIAPMRDMDVTYQYMSDDFARANGATSFLPFSLALRMMHTVFGAFDGTPSAQALLNTLNKHNVYFATSGDGAQNLSPCPMGKFYEEAASKLIDYDPFSGGPVPSLRMPHAWDSFSSSDAAEIVERIAAVLQGRSTQVTAPLGRFQDATRLYRARVFVRIKDRAGCPPVWSNLSDPFRIAPWFECAGRTQAPVPLPDPTDQNFRANAKPNCSFAVPAGLMNAIQGTRLSDLTAGSSGPSGGGIQLNWICGFSIPLITICAFFVLNIFLTLLNLVFSWMAFIKICIPFPMPTPANSGEADGT